MLQQCDVNKAEQLRHQLEQQYGSLGDSTKEDAAPPAAVAAVAAVGEDKISPLQRNEMDVNTDGGVDVVNTSSSDDDDTDPGALYVAYINRNFANPSRSSDSSFKKRQ